MLWIFYKIYDKNSYECKLVEYAIYDIVYNALVPLPIPC